MNNQNGVSAVSFVENALEHHGIKGQSWGKRHGPPYPLEGDDKRRSREFAKENRERKKKEKEKIKIQKRIVKEKIKKEKADKKEQKQQEDEEKKQQQTAKKLAKEKAKYSKDPKTLYEHRDMYSPDEIAECLKTFELNARVKSYIDKDYDRAKSNMERFASWSGSAVRAATNLANAYNLYASIDRYLGGDKRVFTTYRSEVNLYGEKPESKDRVQ